MTMPQSIDAEQRSTGGSPPYWPREISPAATGDWSNASLTADRFPVDWIDRGTGGAVPIYAAISRASQTAAPRLTAEIRTIDSLKLEKRVQIEREHALIEEESLGFADVAVKEALAAIRKHNLGGAENIAFAEDGILSIQWRKIGIGAAIVFTGDGKVSVSIATPNKLYSQRPMRINVTEALPNDFLKAVGQP